MEKIPERLREQPEHVELVKHDVQDMGDMVEFRFDFAGRIDGGRIGDLMAQPESAVRQIIGETLVGKRWLGTKSAPPQLLIRDVMAVPDERTNDDGASRIWIVTAEEPPMLSVEER